VIFSEVLLEKEFRLKKIKYPKKILDFYNGLSDDEKSVADEIIRSSFSFNDTDYLVSFVPYERAFSAGSFNFSISNSLDANIDNFVGILKSVSNHSTQTDKKTIESALTSFKTDSNEAIEISLPCTSMVVVHAHNWTLTEDAAKKSAKEFIDIFVSAVETGQKVAKQYLGNKAEAVKSGIEGIVNTAKEGADFLVTKLTTEFIDTIKPIISSMGGAVYVPRSNQYSGVVPKSFNFNWNLIPFDKEDYENIENIIKIFRELSYATLSSTSGDYAIFKNPVIWKVKFPYNDNMPVISSDYAKEKNVFYCVVDGIQTSYSKGTYPTYNRDGGFDVVNLQIAFREFVPSATKNDAFNGYTF